MRKMRPSCEYVAITEAECGSLATNSVTTVSKLLDLGGIVPVISFRARNGTVLLETGAPFLLMFELILKCHIQARPQSYPVSNHTLPNR